MYVAGYGVPFVTDLVVFSLFKSLGVFSNLFVSCSVEFDGREAAVREEANAVLGVIEASKIEAHRALQKAREATTAALEASRASRAAASAIGEIAVAAHPSFFNTAHNSRAPLLSAQRSHISSNSGSSRSAPSINQRR